MKGTKNVSLNPEIKVWKKEKELKCQNESIFLEPIVKKNKKDIEIKKISLYKFGGWSVAYESKVC